ncbi:MAG: transposase [Gammaproteobacteria bacterium]
MTHPKPTTDLSLPPLPAIPLEEQTPTVKLLLALIEQYQTINEQQHTLIEHQHTLIADLEERVHALEAEVRRLKKLPPRPSIKPSALDKDRDDDDDEPPGSPSSAAKRKRPGSAKRKKRLKIHRSVVIAPEYLPPGSRFRGYQNFLVQDLTIRAFNTQYRLARYATPSGEYLVGKLPEPLNDGHFGPTLKSYILHQYHHQRVTQPLLLEQLRQWGIDISTGQLNRILTEQNARFHQEKDQLLLAGLHASSYVHVDDTGARHRGKNGYCTHIGNERFAYFKSTASKSRINFLALLRGPHTDYRINEPAMRYLRSQKLPRTPRRRLGKSATHFPDAAAWNDHLDALNITTERHRRIATEAALLGSLIAHGLPPELVILSDDAGQFDVLRHALCWIHAERNFQTLLPFNDTHTKQLAWVRTQLWDLYDDLKTYKRHPTPEAKQEIEQRFDELCRTKTTFQTLNQALKRLHNNKAELLLVLQRPDIPLHNNLSERDIREYVIKRKISGSTRSDNGRRARDTFASLKKTCQKLGIGFWDYLLDRLTLDHRIPPLPEIVAGTVSLPP